ncbi:MAG: oligosaccharide flippase family protein [Candidatus Cloacimonadota bacterium]
MNEISLKKNIALTSVSKVITIFAAFMVNWFISRYLGPDLRGRYVYLFTLNSIIWMFLDMGVHKTFPYILQHDKRKLNSLYSLSVNTWLISIVSIGILFIFGSGIFSGLLDHQYPRYILLILGIYVVTYQFYMRSQFIQLGMNWMRDYTLLATLPTVVFLLLIVPLFWLMPIENRMEYSFMLNVGVFIACLALVQWRFRGRVRYQSKLAPDILKETYKLGFKAFVSEYLILLMMRVDLIILKALGSFSQVGVYTLAVNFIDMINISCNTIGAVLLVKLASLKDDHASLAIMRKIFLMIGIVDLLAVLGMIVIGKWFIIYLYGPGYADAYWSFLLMIPAVFGITLGALFNTFIWSKGFPVISIIAPVVPLLLKLGLNYLLIPKYGLFGTSITSSLSYVLWLIILVSWYFISHKDMSIRELLPRREDLRALFATIAQGKDWLKCRIASVRK